MKPKFIELLCPKCEEEAVGLEIVPLPHEFDHFPTKVIWCVSGHVMIVDRDEITLVHDFAKA